MRRIVFVAFWLAATVWLAWEIWHGQREFSAGGAGGMLAILACTAALLWWLPGPKPPAAVGAERTARGRFALTALLLLIVLLALRDIVGPPLLFGFPPAAVLALIWLRQPIVRREALYALSLAIVATVAGLGLGSAKFSPLAWAVLQVALVLPCLLAGWGMLRRTGLLQAGLGRSLFVDGGWRPALIGALQGVLLGVPWALFNVSMGGSNNDAWVQSWWQPLAALQPGIAEEAWGRVFLIALLFLILRQTGTVRAALATAVIVPAYWFAYLHTPGGFSANSIFSTLLVGTVYTVPLSYLWLRRGLEPAIGFHIWQDFFRFAVAFFLNQSLWLA